MHPVSSVRSRSFTSAATGSGNALVAGAGTAAANGTYTARGTEQGKPYYNLTGQPDSVVNSAIYYHVAGQWIMSGSAGEFLYVSGASVVALPWSVPAWERDAGDNDPPTVTQAP